MTASGEEAATAIIASIIPGQPTLVTCVDDERMDFQASLLCLVHSCIAKVCKLAQVCNNAVIYQHFCRL